jgi:RNA polymerase sigma factor (TIGR02999 family)
VASGLPSTLDFGILPPLSSTEAVVAAEQSGAVGDAAAVAAEPNEQLFVALYGELRNLAQRQIQHSGNAPISPTTLLHEAYLGMSGRDAVFANRARFMGYAARVMRSLIIDLVRERRALKRGSEFQIIDLASVLELPSQEDAELSRLADALDALAVQDQRLAEVVDLKYFCGFTFEEIALQRGTSTRTVQRDWDKARMILFRQLDGPADQ